MSWTQGQAGDINDSKQKVFVITVVVMTALRLRLQKELFDVTEEQLVGHNNITDTMKN